MGKTQKEKIYLNEEEKKILGSLLEEWNSKPDKKARDSFISGEALPRIQQLDLIKFRPDVISKDKGAKVKWEKRVQVRYPTFSVRDPSHKTIQGGLYLVQKQQALQGPSGIQAGKKDSIAPSGWKAQIRRSARTAGGSPSRFGKRRQDISW